MSNKGLSNNELTFQLIVDSIPNAVFLVNKDGKIACANSITESLLGYGDNDLTGRDVELFITNKALDKFPAVKDILTNPSSTGSKKIGRPLYAQRGDGTEFQVEIDISAFLTKDNPLTLVALTDITNKKKAEEEQALLAAIVNSSDDAIISKTLDGTITSWNKGAEKIFGYNANEVIGKNISILIPEERINEEPYIIEKIKVGEHVAHYETQRRRKDGSHIFISLTVSPIKNKDGKIVGASKIARDITEKAKSEQQLRMVVESAPNAMVLVNKSGEIILVNTETEKVFGYTRDELIGQKIEMLIPDHLKGNHPYARNSFFAKPQARAMGTGRDLFAMHKDGTEFPVEIGLNPIETQNGNMILAAIIDITERKRIEADELDKKSELRFRAIIENSNDVFTLIDGQGNIIYLSPSMERLFGFSNEAVFSQNAVNFFHPDDLPNFILDFQEAASNPGKPVYGQHRVKHIDGHYLWTEGSTTSLLQDENVRAVVGNFRDISERKLAEENILKLNRLYSFLSHINQAVVHLHTEQALFNETCRIAVETGKFDMAWIGIADEDNNTINLVAHGNATPDDLKLFTNLKYTENGPIDTVLKTGNYFLCNNTSTEPSDPHWEAYLNKKGLGSFIALPVNKAGKTIGMLNIFSSVAGFFDEKEIALLVEAAGDISFAIDVFIKEDELKISENKFREFFESAPEAILILDLNNGGIVSEFNNNALSLFKYSAKQILTKTPEKLSPALQPDGSDSRLKAMELIQAAVNGKKPVFEWLAIDAEGKEFFCEIRLARLSQINDNYLIVNIIDITERKNSEMLREKMTLDLMQRNKGLEQFMYIVSHNLRAPVANILGISSLMHHEKESLQLETELIEALDVSVKRLDNVIIDLNQVLQLKQEISEKRELISFTALVEDIKISIADTIAIENVNFIYDFSESDTFFTLKTYMYSVFYNLILNSIKYRQPDINPVIEIKSTKLKNKIILTFSDNGLGIDLAKKGDEVFGLYKRFHSHLEGKGMGLYMVKTQIEIMGGHISIASEVNKGTTFTIEFEDN